MPLPLLGMGLKLMAGAGRAASAVGSSAQGMLGAVGEAGGIGKAIGKKTIETKHGKKMNALLDKMLGGQNDIKGKNRRKGLKGIYFAAAATAKQSSILGGLLGTISQMVGLIMDLLIMPFVPIIVLLIKGIGWLVRGLKWLLDGSFDQWLSDMMWGLWDKMKEWGKTLWEWAGKLWEMLKTLPGTVWDLIKQGWDATISGIKSMASWIGETLGFMKPWIQYIKDKALDVWNWLGSVWDNFKNKLEDFWIKIKEFFSYLTSFGWITDIKNWIWTKVGETLTKFEGLPFIGGLADKGQAILDALEKQNQTLFTPGTPDSATKDYLRGDRNSGAGLPPGAYGNFENLGLGSRQERAQDSQRNFNYMMAFQGIDATQMSTSVPYLDHIRGGAV